MKDATVTYRLKASLLARVDELVQIMDRGDVGKGSRSAVLREALEIGVTEMERRVRPLSPWHDWMPLEELRRRVPIAASPEEAAALQTLLSFAEHDPARWAGIRWWTEEARAEQSAPGEGDGQS